MIVVAKQKRFMFGRRLKPGHELKIKNPKFYFYVPDDNGEYDSIDGRKLSKVECESSWDFKAKAESYRVSYEADIQPLERFLMDNYYKVPAPNLSICFLDIEVDYKTESFEDDYELPYRMIGHEEQVGPLSDIRGKSLNRQNEYEVYDHDKDQWIAYPKSKFSYCGKTGYSRISDPYAPINAITLYMYDLKQYITLVVPPKNWDGTLDKELLPDSLSEIIICKNEKELLSMFLDLIEDVDVISRMELRLL
jgi:DNA polymerase elongation subunit (family B)